jgi:GTP-binding protein
MTSLCTAELCPFQTLGACMDTSLTQNAPTNPALPPPDTAIPDLRELLERADFCTHLLAHALPAWYTVSCTSVEDEPLSSAEKQIGTMKPLVAIVGRPNVGKSTFFNRMIGQPLAIVEDLPGTTRDRIYGESDWNGREFTLVDTGGLDLGESDDITRRIRAQVQLAIEEADVIVFIVDASAGITESDTDVADLLRRSGKPLVLAANKADNEKRRNEAVDFYELGLGEPITMSSSQGTGTGDVLDAIVEKLPPAEEELEAEAEYPRVAIVGRPNVGKSSLVNAVLGQERVIVSDIPGTTRDTIDTLVEHNGHPLTLIDTAGIRRRGRVGPGVEKYSVLRATRAIERSDVAVLLIDATEGITAQDVHIAGAIHEAGRGVVVVINKWDLIKAKRAEHRAGTAPVMEEEPPDAQEFKETFKRDLKFLPYAPVIFAAAKTRYHVANILDAALKIAEERTRRIPTARLNEVVKNAVLRHPPTHIKGRTLRVYYVTQAEVSPPTFIFFVNDPELLHFSYERYLENQLRLAFGFEGTAIRLRFRQRERREKGED